MVDVEGLNISGKWGKKLISPQSAFLVLPENSHYLKKKKQNKTKQSCNQNISSTWLEIRCIFVVDVNCWKKQTVVRLLSDFCCWCFFLLLLLPCRWLCLYVWRVIKNKKRYTWKRVQYIDTSIWIGFGVRADMFCTTSPDINSWNFQRLSFDFWLLVVITRNSINFWKFYKTREINTECSGFSPIQEKLKEFILSTLLASSHCFSK